MSDQRNDYLNCLITDFITQRRFSLNKAWFKTIANEIEEGNIVRQKLSRLKLYRLRPHRLRLSKVRPHRLRLYRLV